MKFGGTLQQLLKPITVMWPTIEIFKIRDGGDGRLKKSLFWHNSSTDCPISAKFCTRKQDGMSTRATWQKLQIFKIQDGGRPPFWKSLNCHISVKKSSDFDETWYTTSDIEPGDSHVTKIWNFWNLYEEAERHVDKGYETENAFFKIQDGSAALVVLTTAGSTDSVRTIMQRPPADLWRLASSHPAWSYWSDATVLNDYAMTTTTNLSLQSMITPKSLIENVLPSTDLSPALPTPDTLYYVK